MPITSKFLKQIRENAESSVPTHPSDAAVEVPDSLEGKMGARAVKPEQDGTKAGVVSKSATHEEKEEDVKENAEASIPTHPSDAASQVPDKLSETADKEDEMKAESKESEDEKAKTDSEESDEEKKLSEETDEDAEDESSKKMNESDLQLSAEEEDKLAKDVEDDVKEAATALTKDEELPESFKTKVASIFEAAVKRAANKHVTANKARLVEAYNSKLETSKKQISETLVNKVDGYLDYVVEEWMKENKVAIESALRSEITEKFISGLKNLFENHYIEVPAEKTNVVSEQELKIKKLEKELNDELVNSVELRKENIRLKRSSIIKKLTEGMTVSDSAKFSDLCNGVSFDDAETFGQKLKVIKETYFPKTPKSSDDIDASLLTEGGLKHEEQPVKTEVDFYAQAISRMVKK